jgi:hypothetical protein
MSKPFLTVPVVGLHGPERSGKDTAAAVFVRRYGWAHVKFADGVYLEAHQLYPELAGVADEDKDRPLKWLGGRSKRDILIEIGQSRRGQDPDYWVKAWIERVRAENAAGRAVVCSDVRMDNEAAAIRRLGGLIVAVSRPGVGFRGGPTSTDHSKEWACIKLCNSADIIAFERKVAVVAGHIQALNAEIRHAA